MTVPARSPEAGSVRGLRRVEYETLVSAGLLDGEPVELLRGSLVRMSPQDPEHADVVRWLAAVAQAQLPPGWAVSSQLPLAVEDDSEPEPDLAIVPAGRHRAAHPATAALVVEVARTSLHTDLVVKPPLYAAAGVPDYWVVDLAARMVHVHRNPGRGGYGTVIQVADGSLRSVGPVELLIDVVEMLTG